MVSDAPPIAESRPSFLLRAAAGAWHLPAAFVFLLRRPFLWPMAILPAALAAAAIVGGFVLGLFALGRVDAALAPAPGRVPEWMGFLITLALWVATLAAAVILGLAVALALTAPILDRLSRRVEALLRGAPVDAALDWRWDLLQALRSGLCFLVAAPVIFVLGIVPIVGPIIGLVWGAYALALQETDGPLSRRGLDFRARRAWLKCWLPESLGFGFAGLVTLIVPVVNFLLAPAIVVGATRLVLELEEEVS